MADAPLSRLSAAAAEALDRVLSWPGSDSDDDENPTPWPSPIR